MTTPKRGAVRAPKFLFSPRWLLPVLASLVLSACGGDDNDATPAPPATVQLKCAP